MKERPQFVPRILLRISNASRIWIISLLPLVLLAATKFQFGADWPAHIWLTSYFGEFFKSHFYFPQVLNTDQLSGMPYPVFYGYLLYPVLGLVSAVTGAAVAVRLAVFAVLLLQCREAFRLIFQVSRDRALSLVTAAVTCWSTYALTNLYTRGALNEMIAVALLTSAFCSLCRFILLAPAERRPFGLASGFLFFVLAASAHPITALFGGFFLAVVTSGLLLFAEDRGRLLRGLTAGALGTSVVLGPWLYAVLKFSALLVVAHTDSEKITYFPDSIDAAWSRLMPFPYDHRMAAGAHLPPDQSPYLDAQINAGLLILAVIFSAWSFAQYRRGLRLKRIGVGLMTLSWALFLGLFALSVTPALGSAMPAVLRNLQFAYRLVSYLNLSLLSVIAGSLMAFSASAAAPLFSTKQMRWLLSVTMGIAIFGLAIKLAHGTANRTAATPGNAEQVLRLPDDFFGWNAYAIANASSSDFPEAFLVPMPVGRQSSYGQVQAVTFELLQPRQVLIRVQPFPWNHLLIDGRSSAERDPRSCPDGMVVSLPSGTHQVEYTWQPDRAWAWLTFASRITLFFWISLVLVLHFRGSRKKSPSAG